ncbi:hypothetical protein BaRGS_00011774 [Batillaria attramentaria]|uniref:IMS import disulfide relay-system CHCH-CHCH-like Cx9C domain-containing protein n=1 Tax=Batillaria attramentaria TaxID=370345 RepID=A0ABD0LCK6_9CAEN
MQLVEQQCSRYLTMFSNCLQEFPQTWHLDCERQKLKLAKCAESEPTIVKIKTECKTEFLRYEGCINSNPVHTHFCLEDYNAFNKCAEKFTDKKTVVTKSMNSSKEKSKEAR